MPTPPLLLGLAASLALASAVRASDEPTLEERLDKLAEDLEAARERARVPGLSIAIVKDDEVVWARGFGLADVEGEQAAEADTVYAAGSTTKAFTGALLGMLIDEGRVHWDDAVTRYLPYFDLRLRGGGEDAECTLRDLLSHRHGFARMSILWNGSGISREELLRTAAGAEPWDDFRAGFHYSNVAYLAAGEAAAVAAGSPWEELVAARIFEPLGMGSSTVSVPAAQDKGRMARGYESDEAGGQCEPVRRVELAALGPAGALNTSALDMAQWLRLQLGRGEIDGRRLISAARIVETWEPQIEIGDGKSYGLGWMLREHDGRRLIEHGGNIDGFSAQVAFCPEEELGYVLLMNLDTATLQEASIALVFDALLDPWPEASRRVASPSDATLELEDYTGTYVANFGSFRDTEFEVRIHGDRLALEIPGQQSSELEAPNAEGKWLSALSDRVAVSFQRDEQARVVGLTIHQGDFLFEVPRKGFEPEFEPADPELEKYVGTYVRAQGGKQVEIAIVGGRLTLEDRGRQLALEAPDAEGHAALRARADQGATFAVDAAGNVESFLFHGDAGDRLFTRVVAAPGRELPTLEELCALRGTEARVAALRARGGTRVRGEVWIAQAGVRGTHTLYSSGGDRYASHLDFGRFGRIDRVVRGNQAWSYTSLRGFDELRGEELTQARLAHPEAVEGDWSAYFDRIELLRNDTLGERPVHVARLHKRGLPSRIYWIDAERGDVLRVQQTALDGSLRIPVTIHYSGFEEVDGIRRAMHVEIENPATGKMVLKHETFEFGLDLDDELFALEDADAAETRRDE